MEPRIEYAKTEDGVSIAYAVLGEGPTVVLTTGAFGDVNTYASGVTPEVDQLVTAGRRVVLFDGRGTGSSDRDAVDFSLEARVRDLEGVVSKMGLERFALVGRLHGGVSAAAYAAGHPREVTHLVLWSAYARTADYYTATAYGRAIRSLSEMAEEDWEFFTLTLAHWATAFKDPERAQQLSAAFRTGMTPQAYLKFAEDSERIDVSAMLAQVSVPTLVVREGRAGPSSVPELAKPLASGIPGAQFVAVRGRGSVTEAILEFTRGDGEKPAGREAAPRSGVVTILFTDIVGHTEMMSRLGDERGRDVLREHERITREMLKAHGGTEVKTMGDGFLASFGSVTKAVECAAALQKAFDERNRGVRARHAGDVDVSRSSDDGPATNDARGVAGASPLQTPVEPLHVRVGLNAGEPIEEEGDLFGATVIMASRIAATAEGGEVRASLAVRELCAGKGFLFADLGEHTLRGFEDPVRVFEVKWRE